LTSRLGAAWAVRASRIVRVRVTAMRVLLFRWWAHPPRPRDMATTARHAWRVLLDSGPAGLLRTTNEGIHDLAREGSRTPLVPWIRERLGTARYRAEYRFWWIPRFDRLRSRDVRAIRQATAQLAYRPLLSVLMPVYNTDERWLRKAIESVQEQLYPNWELCIADDHSSDRRVGEVLREIQSRDARVKLHFREVNGHISAASNSALALASGDFIVLLDHDDVLPRHALAAVVHELNRHPDADIVYSDEDRIDEQGSRYDPYFKPDWNPELFYSHNLISHLGVYRTAMVRHVGGFREGFEGSQDYEMALRVVEQTQPSRIRHIPHILYHWRAIPGSAALDVDQKSYATDAARLAVQAHFRRIGVEATIEPAPHVPYYQRVRYQVPEPLPHVTIIIPTKDRTDLLSVCVNSIVSRSTYGAFDIVIVDNGSIEPASHAYFERAQQDPRVSVMRIEGAFNFSRLNNLAAARARGLFLCFLNNDTEVITPGWLEEMVSLAVRDGVGPVGAMLYYPNNTMQHAGVVLGLGGIASHPHRGDRRGMPGNYGRAALTQTMSAVTAACMVLRKSTFEAVGGFDESLAVAYNDVDLCLRLGARGFRSVWTPNAELYHFESISRGDDLSDANRARFEAESQAMRDRWQALLTADPYYNPNLSLTRADMWYAYPPRHPRPWWQGKLY
jgi:glycosyltransferase involved in cell wall biosynthesis